MGFQIDQIIMIKINNKELFKKYGNDQIILRSPRTKHLFLICVIYVYVAFLSLQQLHPESI